MKVTQISRENLYKREYQNNTITTLGSGHRLEGEPLDGLAKILSIMIREGGRVCWKPT